MVSALEKIIKMDNTGNDLKVVPFSDVHIGAASVNKTFFKNTIKYIEETEDCVAVGLGDYCDCINIQDKRFDIKSIDKYFYKDLDNLPMAEMEYFIEAIEPIKDKILCMIPGNHEDKLRTRMSIDVMKEIKDDLGIEVGDYMTFLRLKFHRSQFHTTPVIFWMQHGWFSGRKMGGQVNQLNDIAATYNADVYLAGHSHNLWANPLELLSMPSSGLELVKSKRIFGNTGTFMETTAPDGTSYSEMKAFPVAKMGTLRLDINPRAKPRPDIHIRI